MLRTLVVAAAFVATLAMSNLGVGMPVDDSSSALNLANPAFTDSSAGNSNLGTVVRVHRAPVVVVSAQDKHYLTVSTQGNLFEIQKSRLALARSANHKVKAFATQLIKDHTAALKAETRVAHALGVALPAHVNAVQAGQLKALNKQHGTAFDLKWLAVQIQAHKLAIATAKQEVHLGTNKAVKALAAASLPVLQHHLKVAVALYAALTAQAAHDSSTATTLPANSNTAVTAMPYTDGNGNYGTGNGNSHTGAY